MKVMVINRLFRNLRNNLVKNILMITSGTVFAQILNLALLPIITRLYTPDQYGVVSVFVAILATMRLFSTFNYEMGMPIAEDDEKAINVLALSVIILLSFLCIFGIVLLFWGDKFLTLLNGGVLVEYKYFLVLGLLFVGSYHILTQWAYRKKDFRVITKTKFIQPVSQNFINIVLGLMGKGAVGLLLGKIIGQSAGISSLTYPLIKDDKNLLKKINKREILWALKRYIRFPLYTTPRKFIGEIIGSLPILFLSAVYGPQIAGLYGLANGVIQLPMNIIGTSVSNVFYAESAALRRSNPHRIKELSNKLLKYLIIFGLFPISILVLFGEFLFSLVFGSKWAEAGVYAALLSFGVFSKLIFRPISNIFDICERQELALILNIFGLVLVLLVFGITSYLALSSYWTVGLYSVAIAALYLIQYILAQKVLNEEIFNS